MLPLDQSPDEESPLLNVVPFKGEAVVSHFRLQIGLIYQSVNELPNTYNSEAPRGIWGWGANPLSLDESQMRRGVTFA